MKNNYKLLLQPYHQQAIEALQSIVRIDSVLDLTTATKEKPFGEGVDRALKLVGAIAEKDGFAVDYCDGYATEISIGSGERLVGIFAHLDVVPTTGEWKYEPFSATIKDDIMYGRGTSDDKGPGFAAYFALKALKEAGLIEGYRVKLVFGGNEETGSKCMHYYFHSLKKEAPTYGFTPDAAFPLIYGEKGVANYAHQGIVDLFPVLEIRAGSAPNLVIDEARAVVAYDKTLLEALKASGLKFKLHNDGNHSFITIYGVSAHGSMPETGVNAGVQLITFLGQHYKIAALNNLADLYSDTDGKALGQYYETEALHATTYNIGTIDYKETGFRMVVNFRYPENVDPAKVINKINGKSLLQANILSISKPLYYDPNLPFIKALHQVYIDETGDTENLPMTIGGGTYAKECPNTIAFGSAFPGANDLIHSPGEHIQLKHFRDSMAIYAHAIYALGKEV